MRSTHLIIFQLGTEYCFQKGTSKIKIEKYLNRNKAHTVYNTTYSIWPSRVNFYDNLHFHSECLGWGKWITFQITKSRPEQSEATHQAALLCFIPLCQGWRLSVS